ncbi:MAG: rRNA maturation RNase YbeY [Verrucomicrobiales bacterium]|nr:rRNA maturation RNase YbeY [Verrucomicrobiales bacterium]
MSKGPPSPDRNQVIEIFDHAEAEGIRILWLQQKATEALPHCVEEPGSEEAMLPGLSELEVSLVDDATIGKVHAEFLDDPTPTDVITFHHGEILVSVETAKREAPVHGNTIEEETLLYLIHGLLHLNGHTDLVEPARAVMHELQEKILRIVLTSG